MTLDSLNGSHTATIRIGYVYQAVYQQPANFAQSFGTVSGSPITGSRARQEITIWQEQETTIGSWDNRGLGLGGWSLNKQHSYDTAGQTLYIGSGERHSAVNVNSVISTVAGNGIPGYRGDGGPATSARINYPYGVAVDSKGNIFIADLTNHYVRKVSPDGIITTVAGNGMWGYSGDGGPATSAQLNPYGITVDSQGNLFIADSNNSRIRKVSPHYNNCRREWDIGLQRRRRPSHWCKAFLSSRSCR